MMDFLRFSGGAFSKQSMRDANHQTARMAVGRPQAATRDSLAIGCSRMHAAMGHRRWTEKTRPSAQYAANDLASPGY
jgi:hypothetical protein